MTMRNGSAMTHDPPRSAAIRSVWPRALGALAMVIVVAGIVAWRLRGCAATSLVDDASTVAASAPAAAITASPTPSAPTAASAATTATPRAAPTIAPSPASKSLHRPAAATATPKAPEARTIF